MDLNSAIYISKDQDRIIPSEYFEYQLSIGLRYSNRFETIDNGTQISDTFEPNVYNIKYIGKGKKKSDNVLPALIISKKLIAAPMNYINANCTIKTTKKKRKNGKN